MESPDNPRKISDCSAAAVAEGGVSRSEYTFLLALLAGLAIFLAVATGILLRTGTGGPILLWVLTGGTSFVAIGCLFEAMQRIAPVDVQPEVVRHRGSTSE